MGRKKTETPTVKNTKIPPEDIRVRLLKKEDVSGVIRVVNMYRRGRNHPYIPSFDRKRLELVEQSINDDGHLIFVAEIDDEIVGFFDVRYYEDWFRVCLHIHIEHMFVSNKKHDRKDGRREFIYQRRGIGSKLMRNVLSYFRKKYLNEYHLLFFYSEGNITIERLMKKHGFWITPASFFVKKVKSEM